MTTLIINNKKLKISVSQKSTFILIKKRFMHRVTAAANSLGNRMARPIVSNIVNVRSYPGEYSTGHLNHQVVDGVKARNYNMVIRVIQRNSDGSMVGGFTTTPKPSFNSALIDKQEYVNDKAVPTDCSGKYVSIYDKSKILQSSYGSIKPVFKKDEVAQKYMDKNEPNLKEIFDNHKTALKDIRLNEDDSRFYHENFP
jgi:hypothetical protein